MYRINKVAANPTVDFAAEELKKYLRMMMPRCGEVPITYNPEAKDGFRVGLMADFGLDMSDAEDILLDDIIYVQTDEAGGIIAGSNPVAALIAVYRYLKAQGCRWLFPGIDGEWIPVVEGLKAVKYRKLADHRYRGQCNEGAEFQQDMIEVIDFTPKIGMNTFMIEHDIPTDYYGKYYAHQNNVCREPVPVDPQMVLQWKRQCEVEIQKRGLHFHDMGHGWTVEPFGVKEMLDWGDPDEVVMPEESLQYMAMVDGKREMDKAVPLNTNVCMSNPKTREIMAKYIADYAEVQNNVDFLHIWLADSTNRHCECEECQKKDTSDWYVMLLNDIDAELTRRNLKTHLVFIVYVDTFWPPVTEKLNNTKRFTMLYAPITRLYTETYGETPDMSKVAPYRRNKLEFPKGMAACLAYLKQWQQMWKGDCFCYEYHFWIHQYKDPSALHIARLIHDDIVGLRKNGLGGIVEDGSQRSYFPNGIAYYTYGETLYDSSVSFEELVEDYFSHAYGEDWKLVLEFLTKIRDRLDYAYLHGLKSADPEKGAFYAPEYVEKAAEVPAITADFAPVVRRNLRNKYRATQVSWQLMNYFLEYADCMARIVICMAQGDQEGTARQVRKLDEAFSRHEVYIERYYDHFLAMYVIKRFAK